MFYKIILCIEKKAVTLQRDNNIYHSDIMKKDVYESIGDTLYPFEVACDCTICRHFEGEEKGTCPAYPDGIPEKFSIWGKCHDTVENDQSGNTIFDYIQ
jgi:hypothetical protein